MKTYDVIVIGTGGIGSAAVFELAHRGVRVLGLDRFSGPHEHGSSHGQTRMIRQAYCEHPDYVPLVERARAQWLALEQQTKQCLYHEVGLFAVGPADGLVVPGALRSADQYGLHIERIANDQASQRFPGFRLPASTEAVFERQAGYLLVEECVLALQAEAIKAGADLKACEVRSWRGQRNGVVVEADGALFSASRLILTAGAWSGQLLGQIRVPLTVLRKPQNWFANDDPRYTSEHGCPVFLFEVPDGIFYGFPQHDPRGVKVGRHDGGAEVDDPSAIDQDVDPRQRAMVARFLSNCLPGVTGPASAHSVCMYTMSPDEHFIVDHHPQEERVCFATGFSGHGFKFAPVMGSALADLALEGETSLPIDFLSCRRFN